MHKIIIGGMLNMLDIMVSQLERLRSPALVHSTIGDCWGERLEQKM